MEWELARRSDSPAKASSKSFREKGENEKRKLRILLLNSTDIGGGAEKIVFTLHQKLLEFGHDSQLFVQVKKADLGSVFKKSQIGNHK
ncbi:MAG: hypothetical protein H6602_12915 [Flavobacteriales bacterium]|nr:hypothetical protein [Flavobacteriales bacterium]